MHLAQMITLVWWGSFFIGWEHVWQAYSQLGHWYLVRLKDIMAAHEIISLIVQLNPSLTLIIFFALKLLDEIFI